MKYILHLWPIRSSSIYLVLRVSSHVSPCPFPRLPGTFCWQAFFSQQMTEISGKMTENGRKSREFLLEWQKWQKFLYFPRHNLSNARQLIFIHVLPLGMNCVRCRFSCGGQVVIWLRRKSFSCKAKDHPESSKDKYSCSNKPLPAS